MTFYEIPKFTRDSNYKVDSSLENAVKTIEKWQIEDNLDINPDFQREHVWTEEQQIAWLEFFIRGGKSGKDIYFNQADWMANFKEPFVLVDGKQRIQAAKRFFNNEIPVFGYYRHQFTDKLYSNTVTIHVNTLKTHKEVIQWYIEFNSGGTPHTKEEIERVKKLLEKY